MAGVGTQTTVTLTRKVPHADCIHARLYTVHPQHICERGAMEGAGHRSLEEAAQGHRPGADGARL